MNILTTESIIAMVMSFTQQSEQLTNQICHAIQQNQDSISFAEFMQLALYAPNLGYYSSGTHKFGSQGDFITAPEISPLFAQTIARQFQQVLSAMPDASIIEIGAGTGVFARDALIELEQLNSLPQRYLIVETSDDLRSRQKTLLEQSCPHLFNRVEWLAELPDQPINGVIFANEVMDAFPVHCFQIKENSLYEKMVTWKDNQFCWEPSPVTNSELLARIAQIQQDTDLPANYASEINLHICAWLQRLFDTLNKGVVLLLDYGYGRREYYHPDRDTGTLMCYFQHQKHSDPFQHVGLQDITAHVDFTDVVESGTAAGFHFLSFTTQVNFLLGCGLLDRAQANTLSEKDFFLQNQAIKKLTLPSQMGEAIKAIAFAKNYDVELIGMRLPNRNRDL